MADVAEEPTASNFTIVQLSKTLPVLRGKSTGYKHVYEKISILMFRTLINPLDTVVQSTLAGSRAVTPERTEACAGAKSRACAAPSRERDWLQASKSDR